MAKEKNKLREELDAHKNLSNNELTIFMKLCTWA